MNFAKIQISWGYWLARRAIRNRVKKDNDHYFELMEKNGVQVRRLDAEQRAQVDEIYSQYRHLRSGRYTYDTHELVYSATGVFEPTVMPETFFRLLVNPRMNLRIYVDSWKDKNYFETYLPNARFPKCILRNISGHYYDASYNMLTEKEADAKLRGFGEYIVKPSLDSGFGNHVQKMTGGLADVVKIFKYNFIVQEVFRQSAEMAAFNESSVNVVRLMTLFIHDRPEVLMAGLRVGNVGALTDYSPTKDGTGNAILGVTDDGVIRDVGYQTCGKAVKQCTNGYVFGGKRIPNYKGMCELALKCHERMPMCRFVAWDMVVAEDGEPAIMEYNLMRPGILYYQWVNGPLFGKDVDKLLETIDKLIS